MFKLLSYLTFTFTFLSAFTFADTGQVAKKTTTSTGAKNWLERCQDWDKWDKPGPPFKIFANSYYVGTCGISAILITGNQGHILIDGGTEAGADVIADNVKKLGFSLSDIKILLHSHEHFDHVAGLAKLQKLSGAKLLASKQAKPVLESGKITERDPQAGTHAPFPPAKVEGLITEYQKVRLGELALTPIATPGHTYGALSWQWQACEEGTCHSIVYADSLSPVSNSRYQFSQHLNYLRAYRAGLNKVANLDCQIILAPHPSAAKMHERLAQEHGLVDPNGCWKYSQSVSKRLDRRLAKEKQ
jgi:metallo-beta-lactamase class B